MEMENEPFEVISYWKMGLFRGYVSLPEILHSVKQTFFTPEKMVVEIRDDPSLLDFGLSLGAKC